MQALHKFPLTLVTNEFMPVILVIIILGAIQVLRNAFFLEICHPPTSS